MGLLDRYLRRADRTVRRATPRAVRHPGRTARSAAGRRPARVTRRRGYGRRHPVASAEHRFVRAMRLLLRW